MVKAGDRVQNIATLRSLMRSVPDFPLPGILFRDITPVLADPAALDLMIDQLAKHAPANYSHIASIEARGFILGSALAARLGKGFIPVRKQGKLPGATIKESYGLEYGKGTLEIHTDAISAKTRVWVVDDLLATGGTLVAACNLLHRVGGLVAGITVMIELAGLDGWKQLSEYPTSSLFEMSAT